MKKILFVFILLFGQNISAQDTLRLMSGKEKMVAFQSMDYDFVYYKKIKKNGKLSRKKKKNLDFIFSINFKDSAAHYVYKQDTLFGNDFSLTEMEYYLEGKRQARKHYKTYKTALIGTSVGVGVAMYSLFPIKYNQQIDSISASLDPVTLRYRGIYQESSDALTIPIPYWEIIPLGTYIYFASHAHPKNIKADDPDLKEQEAFVIGYKEVATNMRVLTSTVSSISSYLLTTLGYIIFDPISN